MREPLSRATITIVEGAEALLSQLPDLARNAAAWDQAVEAEELPYHVALPTMGGRQPLLVLLYGGAGKSEATIRGALLVFAFAPRLFGCRLISNGDRLGRIGVFGPSEDRVEIAALATAALLKHGAQLIRLKFVASSHIQAEAEMPSLLAARMLVGVHLMRAAKGLRWELHLRRQPLFYDLPATPEKATSRLGWSSRKSLRTARNTSVRDHGARFDIDAVLSLAAFMRLNRRSKYPVSSRIARRRFRFAQSGAGFLAGIYTAAGEWMGLAGCRRSGDTAIIDWQMNSIEFAQYSMSLLMRGYLMEAMKQEGKRKLVLEGGTSHRMVKSFTRLPVFALAVRREKIWLRALEWAMLALLPARGITLSLFGIRRQQAVEKSGKRAPPEGEKS